MIVTNKQKSFSFSMFFWNMKQGFFCFVASVSTKREKVEKRTTAYFLVFKTWDFVKWSYQEKCYYYTYYVFWNHQIMRYWWWEKKGKPKQKTIFVLSFIFVADQVTLIKIYRKPVNFSAWKKIFASLNNFLLHFVMRRCIHLFAINHRIFNI